MGDKLGKREKPNKIKALRKRRGGKRKRERTSFYNLRPDLLV